MKIAVISDTHGSFAAWENCFPFLGGIDMLVHCGDLYYIGPRNPQSGDFSPGKLADAFNSLGIPFIVARGNCDAEIDSTVSQFPICHPYAFFIANGKRILVSHGHVFTMSRYVDLARRWHIDIALSGHTHLAGIESIENCIFANPGSLAFPKNFPGICFISENEIELFDVSSGRTTCKASL